VLRPDRHGSRCFDPPNLEDTADLDEFALDAMVVHAASSMEGTHSNVIGLMAPTEKCASDPDDPCVLSVLFDAIGCTRKWGLACSVDGAGYLVLGHCSQDCIGSLPMGYTPFSTGYTYMGAYIADIEAFLAGPSPQELTPLAEGLAPKFLIIDSGTADNYITSSLSRGFLEAGFPHTHDVFRQDDLDGLPCFEIVLRNGVRLGFTPPRYMQDEMQNGSYYSTLRMDDPNIDALFGAQSPVMMLGIAGMMGLYFEFDLEQRRIGVAKYI